MPTRCCHSDIPADFASSVRLAVSQGNWGAIMGRGGGRVATTGMPLVPWSTDLMSNEASLVMQAYSVG